MLEIKRENEVVQKIERILKKYFVESDKLFKISGIDATLAMIRDEVANLLLSYGRESLSDEEFDRRWRELEGKYITAFTDLGKIYMQEFIKPDVYELKKKLRER